MKILCPTDFSARARAAAHVATDLARATDGAVELLHVSAPTLLMGDGTMVAESMTIEQQIREDNQARLVAECRKLAAVDVEVTSQVAVGDVRSAILARAKATGADMIVMGAHGGPALERLVLGSVAEQTVRHADCPILIVPPGAEDTLFRPERAARLRVLVALDRSPSSDGAVAFVSELRRHLPCDVTWLRLYWPVEEYMRLGLTGTRDLFAPDAEVTADLTRTLGSQIGSLPGVGETSVMVIPTWGDPASRILEAAAEAESDLVVMGTESRRGVSRIAHPAVSNRVARLATNVPVVFAPPPTVGNEATQLPAISTVLASTDLSEAGNRAVPFAYALVGGHGGRVELCYVHERSLPSPPYAYARVEGELTGAERARIEAELRALIPVDAERLGVNSRVHVIDGGRAGEAIRQAGERLGADAIVVGTHGHGRAYRALLGSVSEDVVRHARCPVFVVPVADKEVSHGKR